jgi:hypothetical protein
VKIHLSLDPELKDSCISLSFETQKKGAMQYLLQNHFIGRFSRLQNFSSLNDAHQDYDNGNDQKNMDQPAHGRGRHDTQKPQHDQYYAKSPKHKKYLPLIVAAGKCS